MNRTRRPLWWFVLVAGGALVAVSLVLALGHRPAEDFGATTPEPARATATPGPGDVADRPAATTGAVPSVGTRPATPPAAEPVVAPVLLTVPALAIGVPVRPVGVDDEGLMEIPDSGRQVGWYRSARPPAPRPGTASWPATSTPPRRARASSPGSAGWSPVTRSPSPSRTGRASTTPSPPAAPSPSSTSTPTPSSPAPARTGSPSSPAGDRGPRSARAIATTSSSSPSPSAGDRRAAGARHTVWR